MAEISLVMFQRTYAFIKSYSINLHVSITTPLLFSVDLFISSFNGRYCFLQLLGNRSLFLTFPFRKCIWLALHEAWLHTVSCSSKHLKANLKSNKPLLSPSLLEYIKSEYIKIYSRIYRIYQKREEKRRTHIRSRAKKFQGGFSLTRALYVLPLC